MARLLKLWEGVGCVRDTKAGAPQTSARGQDVWLAAEAEDIFVAAWEPERGNWKARRSCWGSRRGQWKGRGFTPLIWAIQPQPSHFPTRLTSSSTTSPVSWGYPCSMLKPCTLGWEDEGNQTASGVEGVGGISAASFCQAVSGLQVCGLSLAYQQEEEQRAASWDWAFQCPGSTSYLPWPKQGRWSDITYYVYALSLLWTQYKDCKHSLVPLLSLHEKKAPGVVIAHGEVTASLCCVFTFIVQVRFVIKMPLNN